MGYLYLFLLHELIEVWQNINHSFLLLAHFLPSDVAILTGYFLDFSRHFSIFPDQFDLSVFPDP